MSRARRDATVLGVWVKRPSDTRFAEDKIAAIGLRVSRWVSSHGISLNVDPDLSHYDGIVPCGIRDAGITSLADLGLPLTLYDVDVALRASFQQAFGPAKAGRARRDGGESVVRRTSQAYGLTKKSACIRFGYRRLISFAAVFSSSTLISVTRGAAGGRALVLGRIVEENPLRHTRFPNLRVRTRHSRCR